MQIIFLTYISLASAITIPQIVEVCSPADRPIPGCASTDLTTANWQASNIDGFLSNFIGVFGTGSVSGVSFPQFFVDQQTPPGSTFTIDCLGLGSFCAHPDLPSLASLAECAFDGISADQVCSRYLSPQAGFVVENFIRYHTGIVNSIGALNDAENAILSSSFISDVVDGLSEDTGNFLEQVFEGIAGLVVGFLPIGRAFRLANRLFTGINIVYSAFGQETVMTSVLELPGLIRENGEIADLAERTKDHMALLIDAYVQDSKNTLQGAQDIVFDSGSVPSRPENEQDNFAFQLAASGRFLDSVPAREGLAAAFESIIKNMVVSAVMNGMGWTVLLDPTELLDGDIPGQVCREGFKGIPGVRGFSCARFQKGEEVPKNPSIIEQHIDFEAAATNALECAGGNPDPAALLTGAEIPSDDLARCLYSFPIQEIAGLVGIGI